jgi:transcriptional regulator with XRE-family HTH domain
MGGPGSGPPDPERRREAARLRAEGLTLQQIAERMGCSRQAVHRLLAATGRLERKGFLRCRRCAAVVCRLRQGIWNTRPVLCLACLAKAPSAPFGERLRAFRLDQGLTVAELADRAGLCRGRVHSYERDAPQHLEWAVLLRLAGVLGAGLLSLGVEGP